MKLALIAKIASPTLTKATWESCPSWIPSHAMLPQVADG
jgi:hypothetical protein